jgi:hypothetical protein
LNYFIGWRHNNQYGINNINDANYEYYLNNSNKDRIRELTFFLEDRLLNENNTPKYDKYTQNDIAKINYLRDGIFSSNNKEVYQYINELEKYNIPNARNVNKLLNEIYEHFKKEEQQKELKKKIREQEYNKIKEEEKRIKEEEEAKRIEEEEVKRIKEQKEQKEPNANVILKQTIENLNIIDVDSEFTKVKDEIKKLEDITTIKNIVDNIKEDKVKKRVKRYLFLKYKNIYARECEQGVNSSECKIWNRFYDEIYKQE